MASVLFSWGAEEYRASDIDEHRRAELHPRSVRFCILGWNGTVVLEETGLLVTDRMVSAVHTQVAG